MNILVTGGAGYIGSVITEELLIQGHTIIILDNLSGGHRRAVAPGTIFIFGDLNNTILLNSVFNSYDIDAVIHLAAYISVAQSMTEPGIYFKNNVSCGINLLECMIKHDVRRLVFSSTAAVFGEPKEIPVTENCTAKPLNAYGESKLMFEHILHWYSRIHGLEYISFRYFNVAGASKNYGSDHHPETNLIPVIVEVALGKTQYLPVFGARYDTKDGTCIRDYVHVLDIARAHIMALDCFNSEISNRTINLGNGKGYSVMEVVETARKITRRTIPVRAFHARTGDPAILIASYKTAEEILGWQPKHPSLQEIIESTWQWQLQHPSGYNDRIMTGTIF
ncbi:MAG: UDP-glucose 4-epimerase GalE [Dehalococcoidales bacterium]|nr:UDP-glucose 4-epimerase GalE [Dehalococcoidales bacterium]